MTIARATGADFMSQLTEEIARRRKNGDDEGADRLQKKQNRITELSNQIFGEGEPLKVSIAMRPTETDDADVEENHPAPS